MQIEYDNAMLLEVIADLVSRMEEDETRFVSVEKEYVDEEVRLTIQIRGDAENDYEREAFDIQTGDVFKFEV